MRLRTRVGRYAAVLSWVALVVTWSSGFIGAELGSRAGAAPLTLLGWRFVLLSCLLLAAVAIVVALYAKLVGFEKTRPA